MNPCPCGYLGDSRHQCTCTPDRYTGTGTGYQALCLTGLIFTIEVPAKPYKELSTEYSGEKSASIRERVIKARDAPAGKI